MTTQSLNQTLFQGVHPDLVKRTSVIKLFFTAFLFILGILLFVVVFQQTDKSSTFSMVLMVVGSVFILYSFFRFFWKIHEVVYSPTGSTTHETSLFFNLRDLPTLSKLVTEHSFQHDDPLHSESNGNVRLDVLFSKDHQFAALQLFQFVPYTYSPVTSVFYFKGEEAASVCAFLASCRS